MIAPMLQGVRIAPDSKCLKFPQCITFAYRVIPTRRPESALSLEDRRNFVLKILTQVREPWGKPGVSTSIDPTKDIKSTAKVAGAISEEKRRATELYDMGKLLGELGNFRPSIAKLEEAADIYAKIREHKSYVKCL